MHWKQVLFAVLALPFLLAAGDDPSGPPSGWTEYSPKDQSFTVQVPGGGRRSERERTMLLKGNRLKVNVLQVEPKGGPTYSAATVLMSPRVARSMPPHERIESLRDAFVDDAKGTVKDTKDINQGRVAGKEYTVETAAGTMRLRLYAAGGRLYVASVKGSQEQVTSKDANAFLDSYKLPSKATEAKEKPADKGE
jgi:hypothetical protein